MIVLLLECPRSCKMSQFKRYDLGAQKKKGEKEKKKKRNIKQNKRKQKKRKEKETHNNTKT